MNIFDYFFENTKNLEKNFVIGNNESISFKVLYTNCLIIADFLQTYIGKNKNIILISNNSVFFITSYLAILKSGNVCVPLDFSIEEENLDYISKQTESNIVFFEKKLSPKLNLNIFSDHFEEDRLNEIVSGQPSIEFIEFLDQSILAEIIFTSGSMGRPKGVMITHENIISNTNSIIEYLSIKSTDIQLVVLPFHYCFGLSLLHTHLKVGAQIVLNNSFLFLGTVIRDLKNYKCTSFSGVPSHYQMLLKKSKLFTTTKFPKLRYVTQAGGKLHDVFINEFVESFPDIKFFIMYGQTEATARLSYLPPHLIRSKIGSIGRAIPGVILKLVDRNGNEISVGGIGEILAKGNNIMLGYYKDQVGTDKILKDDWLCTGDIAKKDEEGFLTIVARKKEILKVGGRRVSPKEIEGIIMTVPLVIDCTIKGVYDDVLGESIEASVVIQKTDKKKDVLKKAILERCRERLALHKIPQTIVFKDQMKFKSTGKKLN